MFTRPLTMPIGNYLLRDRVGCGLEVPVSHISNLFFFFFLVFSVLVLIRIQFVILERCPE